MAKKPGAGGIIVVAVVLGLVTAYLIWNFLRAQEQKSRKNWKPVVQAAVDIKPRTTITRDMLTLQEVPDEVIVPHAAREIKEVEGRMTIEGIKAKEQIRTNLLAAAGQSVSLAFDIKPGYRAISIAAGEVQAVGTAVKPGDVVDILATYTDPVNRQETTKTILQMVKVLAVNRGQTDPNAKEGASTSLTLMVTPEQMELLTAADRQGNLRVALRPVNDETIHDSQGVTVREIRGSVPEIQKAETTTRTPVIISVPPAPKGEITIIRGVQEQTVVTK